MVTSTPPLLPNQQVCPAAAGKGQIRMALPGFAEWLDPSSCSVSPSGLDTNQEILRHEKDFPSEPINNDIKKLGHIQGIVHRITGARTGKRNPCGCKNGGKSWQYLPLAGDDPSPTSSTWEWSSPAAADAATSSFPFAPLPASSCSGFAS